MLLYITNKVAAIARELYPNMEFNIIYYCPRDLDTNCRDYSYLIAAVSLSNKKRKHLTPTTEYSKLSYYLNYEKALYKLYGKLINKLTDRLNGLSSKNIDLLSSLGS